MWHTQEQRSVTRFTASELHTWRWNLICSYASATCRYCFCNPVSRSLCWQWWYKGSYNGRFGDLGGQEQKHSPRLVPRYIHCRGSVMWWCFTISKKENKNGISGITKKVDAQPSPLTCPVESPTKFRTKKKSQINFVELKMITFGQSDNPKKKLFWWLNLLFFWHFDSSQQKSRAATTPCSSFPSKSKKKFVSLACVVFSDCKGKKR